MNYKLLQEPRQHSLEAVGILKKATYKENKYLIYKINNSQFIGGLDYIFKSNTPMALLAIGMDWDAPEYPLPMSRGLS